MSTPPLGVGYPDGGALASQWGTPIVSKQLATDADGTTLFNGFVGNWSQLSVALTSFTVATRISFSFAANANGTALTGIHHVDVGPADSFSFNGSIPILGPYVQIVLLVAGGGNSQYSLFVTPGFTTAGKPAGATTGQLNAFTGNLAGGAAVFLPITNVVPGRGILCGAMNNVPCFALLQSTDYLGIARTIAEVETPLIAGVSSAFSIPVIIPPTRISVAIRNDGAALNAYNISLTTDSI